jgi:hypothetical protein
MEVQLRHEFLTSVVGVVSFTHRALYPQRKIPWYPLDRRLCGPQSRSGRSGEKCKFFPELNKVPRYKNILYLIKQHAMKTYGGVEV